MILKKDNLKLGIILGILAPLLGLVIYYFAAFYTKQVGFNEFLGYLKRYRSLLTAVSSLSLVANAILFTLYINSRKDKTAKGIFISTIVYGIGVLVLKFLV